MPSTRDPSLLRRWYEMSPREQFVWSAAFAAQTNANISAFDKALNADKAVTGLRSLNADDDGAPRPEYEIARAGLNISYAEFAPWYRIAVRMTRVGRAGFTGYEEVADEECREAFDRFSRSLSDFY